jgi:CHAT domain-containing protein
LLVSHWPVESGSAVTLMTRLFGLDAPKSRAEALKRAELGLISDVEHPEYAHPAFWAPFVLVGDGD